MRLCTSILLFVMTLYITQAAADFSQTREECEHESFNAELIAEVCDQVRTYRQRRSEWRDLLGIFTRPKLQLLVEPTASEDNFTDSSMGIMDRFFSSRLCVHSRADVFDSQRFFMNLTTVLGGGDLGRDRRRRMETDTLRRAEGGMGKTKARYWMLSVQSGDFLELDKSHENTRLAQAIYKRLLAPGIIGSHGVIRWSASCEDASRLYFTCPFKQNIREQAGKIVDMLLGRGDRNNRRIMTNDPDVLSVTNPTPMFSSVLGAASW